MNANPLRTPHHGDSQEAQESQVDSSGERRRLRSGRRRKGQEAVDKYPPFSERVMKIIDLRNYGVVVNPPPGTKSVENGVSLLHLPEGCCAEDHPFLPMMYLFHAEARRVHHRNGSITTTWFVPAVYKNAPSHIAFNVALDRMSGSAKETRSVPCTFDPSADTRDIFFISLHGRGSMRDLTFHEPGEEDLEVEYSIECKELETGWLVKLTTWP